MIDFDAARQIVADSVKVRSLYPVNDFMVGDYGWENDAEYRVVAGTRKDVTGEGSFDQLTLDAPVVFVAKATGVIRLWFGHRLESPMAGMTPTPSSKPQP